MERLVFNLRKYGRLSDELVEHLKTIVRRKVFKKGDYLLREGMVNRHVWFMESGLIVIYRNGDKMRVVRWILEDDDFVIATDSFESQKPTKEFIVAQEETIVWFINKEELSTACEQFPEFVKIYTGIHGEYREREAERAAQMARHEFDRFQWLWVSRRHLFTRLKKEYLASYLMMTIAMFDKARKARGI